MTYLMESSTEGARLKAKTDRAVVAEELRLCGLRTGDRALEAGCASGAVAEVVADLVGAQGRVLGVDRSEARLLEATASARLRAAAAPANLDYLRGDIAQLPLRTGGLDFVLCRLVLEYTRDPLPLVRELVRVTRPGGRVVLADVDGYGSFHHGLTAERQAAIDAVQGLLKKSGFDPFAGRKLFGMMRQAGVEKVEVHLRPYHLVAGAASEGVLSNWLYKLETLAPLGRKVLGAAWEGHAAAMMDHLRDPETLTYSVLFLAVGTR